MLPGLLIYDSQTTEQSPILMIIMIIITQHAATETYFKQVLNQ